MADEGGAERRRYVRVDAEVPVRYKFFSQEDDLALGEEFEGKTKNVSAGGILLTVRIPNMDWITSLLRQKMYLGIKLELPDREPVRTLARVAWVGSMDEETQTCALGLSFKEITKADQDKLFEYIIASRMP